MARRLLRRLRTFPQVPLNLALRATLVLSVSFTATVVLPGIIAHSGNVFYPEDIRKHLPDDANQRLKQYESLQSQLGIRISSLDSQIASMGKDPNASLLALIGERENTQQRLEALQPPITMIGFYPSPEFLLFPSIYSFLGWMLFGIKLRHNDTAAGKELGLRSILIGLLIYAFYEWPLWVRNFSQMGQKGRVVYSYPNWDVHKGSFVMQEIVIFGFAYLIACVWRRWVNELNHISREIKEAEHESFYSYRVSEPVTNSFINWTYSSAILCLGFLFFTTFYWSLIAKVRDERYLLSAIIAHALWAFSWTIISLPFFSAWFSWNRRKLQELERLGLQLDLGTPEREVQLKILHELEPISELRLSVANLGAAISFVLPLFQLLAK
jgi:hypothetical protein